MLHINTVLRDTRSRPNSKMCENKPMNYTYLYKVQYGIDFVGIHVHIDYMLSQWLRPCMDTVQTCDYTFCRTNQWGDSRTLKEFWEC